MQKKKMKQKLEATTGDNCWKAKIFDLRHFLIQQLYKILHNVWPKSLALSNHLRSVWQFEFPSFVIWVHILT